MNKTSQTLSKEKLQSKVIQNKQPFLKSNQDIKKASKIKMHQYNKDYDKQQIEWNESRQYNHSKNKNKSQLSKPRLSEDMLMAESVGQLHERLKNIHYYYGLRLAQIRSKNAQTSQVIIELVDELQNQHIQKVEAINKLIDQSHQQKRDVGFVDEKMNEIKGNIDDLIQQSASIKAKNQQLQRKIKNKQKSNKQMEHRLQKLNTQLNHTRDELQKFERTNLKSNKLNKEIMQLLKTGCQL